MAAWVRFRHRGIVGFGTLTDGKITVHHGDIFSVPRANGKTVALGDVELLAPVQPSKVVALWNNFHALAAKLNVAEPAEPLYLLKAPSSVTDPGAVVRRPLLTMARLCMRVSFAS